VRDSPNFGELGYKLKPDIYDRSVLLREFLVQFELISLANKWDNFSKSVALASSEGESSFGFGRGDRVEELELL